MRSLTYFRRSSNLNFLVPFIKKKHLFCWRFQFLLVTFRNTKTHRKLKAKQNGSNRRRRLFRGSLTGLAFNSSRALIKWSAKFKARLALIPKKAMARYHVIRSCDQSRRNWRFFGTFCEPLDWKVFAGRIYKFLSTILFPCFESKMNSLQSIFEGVTFTNNDQVLQILQDEGVSVFVASLYTWWFHSQSIQLTNFPSPILILLWSNMLLNCRNTRLYR